VREPVAADLYRMGVVGRIHQLATLANGTTKVLVEGLARVRVTRYAQAGTHLRATVAPAPFGDPSASAEGQALTRRVLSLFEEYVSLHRRIPDEVVALVQGAEHEERQAFAVAAHLTVRPEVRQRLLDVPTLAELWVELSGLLSAEIELLRLERKIEDDVRGSLVQSQREFYLNEQLKAIHKELGNDDGDDVGAPRRSRPRRPCRATTSTGCSACRGRSGPPTCSTCGTPATCSTPTTSGSRRSRSAFSTTSRCSRSSGG
jgi:ATP-dependent Lon protease